MAVPFITDITWNPGTNAMTMMVDMKEEGVSVGQLGATVNFTFFTGNFNNANNSYVLLGSGSIDGSISYPAPLTVTFSGYNGTSEFNVSYQDPGEMWGASPTYGLTPAAQPSTLVLTKGAFTATSVSVTYDQVVSSDLVVKYNVSGSTPNPTSFYTHDVANKTITLTGLSPDTNYDIEISFQIADEKLYTGAITHGTAPLILGLTNTGATTTTLTFEYDKTFMGALVVKVGLTGNVRNSTNFYTHTPETKKIVITNLSPGIAYDVEISLAATDDFTYTGTLMNLSTVTPTLTRYNIIRDSSLVIIEYSANVDLSGGRPTILDIKIKSASGGYNNESYRISTIDSTMISLSGLDDTIVFSARLGAVDSESGTAFYTEYFDIDLGGGGGKPPPTPATPQATLTLVSTTTTTATFTVTYNVSGGYRFYNTVTDVDIQKGFTSALPSGSTITATGLTAGTTYSFRFGVAGTDGNPQSSIVTFSTASGGGGGGGGGVICFLGNAPVLTPAGYRRIDSLRAGDKVTTPDGRAVAIEAVKVMRCAAGPNTNPYVIPKGQFGATKRVLISPRHRVATAKGLLEAQHLGLEQEGRTGTLTYYNLALPGWANMIVAGVEVESLAPVERITVPFATFKALLEKNYGSATPAVREMIRNTCRFLENGMVECPVMRR
jgi:hypothetical protein